MFLLEIDSNPKLAGTIAIIMMVAVIAGCSLWLIVKKVLLNKKYKADEEYVKEYKVKMKERKKHVAVKSSKPETIMEDF